MPLKTQQKSFKFVKNPKLDIHFSALPGELDPTDKRQTSLSEASGTHSRYLWK